MATFPKVRPILAVLLCSLLFLVTGITASNAAPSPDHGPAGTVTKVTLTKPGLGNIKQVDAGDDFTVVLSNDGMAYAWGFNSYGQLGNGTTTDSMVPERVSQPNGVTFTEISAGRSHVLALGSDGKTYAWGDNIFGQLGDGTETDSSTPVVVDQPRGVTFTKVSAGMDYSLALGDDGRAYAWGSNFFGKLGTGTSNDYSTPVVIDQPRGVTFTEISAGYDHSLALGNDGKTYAWGVNHNSQLGNGRLEDSASPVVVETPMGVKFIEVDSGYEYSAALGDDGNVYTWGIIFYRGPDDSMTSISSTFPAIAARPGGVTFTEISAGANHVLALGDNGNSYAWGQNAFGQVGNGSTAPFVSAPSPIDLPTGVSSTQLSAGGFHSVAVGDDGHTYAWGQNEFGQLGFSNPATVIEPQETGWTIAVTDVSFDGVSGTELTDNGDGTVTVLTPALPDGVVDVTVSWTLNGTVQEPVTYADGFTFGTPPPPIPQGNVFLILNDWQSVVHGQAFAYGRIGDEVYVGDWDGNGTDTLAVRRGITFYVNDELRGGHADAEFKYGRYGDEVLVGDWDGNGTDTFAVRRDITFYVNNELVGGHADAEFKYGRLGDEVLVGDWDGDGFDTFAVRRGIDFFANNALRGGNADAEFKYGRLGDEVLVGDFDGDGFDTFTVRRGNTYYVNNALVGGNSEIEFEYGLTTDKAYVGDWDGDGVDTLAINRSNP